nr:ribonuclease H-like domain-containing protein [Tanacetum cinerariifolium]
MSHLTNYEEIDRGYVAFREFKNREINQFYEIKGILRQYSVAKTPQQNGVAEKRNRILIEAAKTMLADSKLPTTFWAKAVNTVCYVKNRVLVVKPHNKTPYELFHDLQRSQGDGFQPSSDSEKKVDGDPSKGSECKDQEQEDNVNNTNNKYGFTKVKNASTPMEIQKPLLKDEDGEEVDVHMYRSMIGSLMCLISSRRDIMFAVCACARYQVNPKVSHLPAVKRIFRLISWQCKKQTVVTNSTTKADTARIFRLLEESQRSLMLGFDLSVC